MCFNVYKKRGVILLRLEHDKLKDFGITKENYIKVHFVDVEQGSTYSMNFATEEDMINEIAFMSSHIFIDKVEECIVYKQNKICMYCKYYNHQFCEIKDTEIDCLDKSCDKFEE